MPAREQQPLHPSAREVPAAGRGLAVLHGTYADYFYVSPHRPFYLVPRELPDVALSWVNCAMGTSAEGLDRANCQPGDHVVIQGAGGLGLCAAALATYRGAAKVIVLDRLPERLSLAARFEPITRSTSTSSAPPTPRRDRIMEPPTARAPTS